MNISKKIITKLKKKNIQISIAESCTGGRLSSALTSISGASKVFSVGLVTYSNQSKSKILSVPKKIIKSHGAVSFQCCISMVNNLSNISQSQVNVSVTGIAGPGGGTKKKPVGLVFVGIKKLKEIKIYKFKIPNRGRNYIQKTAVLKILKIIDKTISS